LARSALRSTAQWRFADSRVTSDRDVAKALVDGIPPPSIPEQL
jgi:hypothetical protein